MCGEDPCIIACHCETKYESVFGCELAQSRLTLGEAAQQPQLENIHVLIQTCHQNSLKVHIFSPYQQFTVSLESFICSLHHI